MSVGGEFRFNPFYSDSAKIKSTNCLQTSLYYQNILWCCMLYLSIKSRCLFEDCRGLSENTGQDEQEIMKTKERNSSIQSQGVRKNMTNFEHLTEKCSINHVKMEKSTA